MSESKIVERHIECPCGKSSDGYCTYDDGHGYCYACSKVFNGNEERTITHVPETQANKEIKEYHNGVPSALISRGISLEAATKYGIKVIATDKGIAKHLYPYFDKEKNQVGTKIRLAPKQGFFWEGEKKSTLLFGQHLFPQGGRTVTLTEGELDAVSVFQMNGGYPAVSISDGAAAACSIIKKNKEIYDYLKSFDKVVISFDMDEAGRAAAKEVAELLGKNAFIMDMPDGKDANEYLQKGKAKQFIEHWYRAKQYTPEDIISGETLWDTVSKESEYTVVPYPWVGLQAMTHGMRDFEMVVVTADPKIGKSSFLKELILHLHQTTTSSLGLLMLEEPIRHTSLDLMGMTIDKRLRIPGNEVDSTVLRDAFNKTVGSGRMFFYNHFGSTEVENIIKTITYLAKVQGCKYIILDHVSIVVSDQKGDERKELDKIATLMKKATMELDICLFVIVHTNRQGTIRGTAAFEQLGNIVMKLSRDKLNPDPIIRNELNVVVEYNRFSGDTGPACILQYNPQTGRLDEKLPEDKELKEDDYGKRQEEPTADGADRKDL